MTFAGLQSVLPILLLLLADRTAGYLAPNPIGKYNVTLTTGELVDHARENPYAATPTPVALMLSVFQPAVCASAVSVPYMPKKTAEYQTDFLDETFNITANFTSLFLDARLPVCPEPHDSCSTPDDVPILLFMPGYSIPRLLYNVLASAIASEGFMVITIDVPNDADIVVYPDGHAVYNNASIVDSPTWDMYPRAADASFVIDQLSNATAMGELLPQRGPKPFNIDHIGMFGHSVGGASSIVAASQDSRIRAAVNWDGTIFGNPPLSVKQPVLFMTHDPTFAPNWRRAWPELKGPKLVVRVANTTHETFSDMPTLLQAAGENAAPLADLLGTIAPAQMVRILTAYTTDWMRGAFAGKEGGPLLDGKESIRFPKTSILKKGNF